MRELAPYLDGSVVAIGNAPTALLALLDMVNEGRANPALIIGMPVGFVACAESKEELTRSSAPYITIRNRRGGSSAAAATVNALLSLINGAGIDGAGIDGAGIDGAGIDGTGIDGAGIEGAGIGEAKNGQPGAT